MSKYKLKETDVEKITFNGTREGYHEVVNWLKDREPRIVTHGFIDGEVGVMSYTILTKYGNRSHDIYGGNILTSMPEYGIIAIHDEDTFNKMHEKKVGTWLENIGEILTDLI